MTTQIPVVASAADLPDAIQFAQRHPTARWYVASRAQAFEQWDTVPTEWAEHASLTAASITAPTETTPDIPDTPDADVPEIAEESGDSDYDDFGDEGTSLVATSFTQEQRDKLADSGAALPDGSFPIRNRTDLQHAIRALGRAKDPAAAKAHIKKRADALGLSDELPDSYDEGVTAATYVGHVNVSLDSTAMIKELLRAQIGKSTVLAAAQTELRAITAGRHSLPEDIAHDFTEALHPRGKDGKFITKGGRVIADDGAGHRLEGTVEGFHKTLSGATQVSVKTDQGHTVLTDTHHIVEAPTAHASLAPHAPATPAAAAPSGAPHTNPQSAVEHLDNAQHHTAEAKRHLDAAERQPEGYNRGAAFEAHEQAAKRHTEAAKAHRDTARAMLTQSGAESNRKGADALAKKAPASGLTPSHTAGHTPGMESADTKARRTAIEHEQATRATREQGILDRAKAAEGASSVGDNSLEARGATKKPDLLSKGTDRPRNSPLIPRKGPGGLSTATEEEKRTNDANVAEAAKQALRARASGASRFKSTQVGNYTAHERSDGTHTVSRTSSDHDYSSHATHAEAVSEAQRRHADDTARAAMPQDQRALAEIQRQGGLAGEAAREELHRRAAASATTPAGADVAHQEAVVEHLKRMGYSDRTAKGARNLTSKDKKTRITVHDNGTFGMKVQRGEGVSYSARSHGVDTSPGNDSHSVAQALHEAGRAAPAVKPHANKPAGTPAIEKARAAVAEHRALPEGMKPSDSSLTPQQGAEMRRQEFENVLNTPRGQRNAYGEVYGSKNEAQYQHGTTGQELEMRRKGQKVQFFDKNTSAKVGPEHANVAPAAAYAQANGYHSPALAKAGIHPDAQGAPQPFNSARAEHNQFAGFMANQGGPDSKAAQAYRKAVERDAARQAVTPEERAARRDAREAKALAKNQDTAKSYAETLTTPELEARVAKGALVVNGRDHIFEAARAELVRRAMQSHPDTVAARERTPEQKQTMISHAEEMFGADRSKWTKGQLSQAASLGDEKARKELESRSGKA